MIELVIILLVLAGLIYAYEKYKSNVESVVTDVKTDVATVQTDVSAATATVKADVAAVSNAVSSNTSSK